MNEDDMNFWRGYYNIRNYKTPEHKEIDVQSYSAKMDILLKYGSNWSKGLIQN